MNDVIIDYSEFQNPPPQDATPETRSKGANVIVLSADPVLIEMTRDSLAGSHRVWRADDATDAADLMVSAGNAVLLVDSSLADQDTRELVVRTHGQFPELSIIVAGRREDEAKLAELISQGIVFRFLHKPASADRIRTFVDATQRRGQQAADLPLAAPRQVVAPLARLTGLTPPWRKIDRAKLRRWSRRSLLLVPLAAVAMLILAWEPWKDLENLLPERDSAAVAQFQPGLDPVVLKLLDSAALAFSQGRLVDPPERNALELYRAALARDPGNQTANQGIDRVADELLAGAEQALTDQDLVRLASAVDAARSARPDHPRLSFFTTQLERERERQGKGLGPLRTGSAVAGRETDPRTARAATERAEELAALADARLRSQQLVGGKDSAHAHLLAAHRLDPANPAVKQGIAALATLLEGNAREAIRKDRLDEADRWLKNAAALDANRPEVVQLRSELNGARLDKLRDNRARLLVLANQRIAQGRLVEPATDSARHYLDLLQAANPDFEGLPDTTALFASRSLAEARRLAAAGDAAGAEELIQAAAAAGAPDSELGAITAEIAAARAPQPIARPASSVLPENSLRRIRFVPPQYPAQALARGIGGWVDIEFTVSTDGSTRDAVVRAAEPAKIFERAALAAVSRWRYEPLKVDGSAVDQRVAARVRFELTD